MYLSSLSIKNFRKFRNCKNNDVSFVSGIETKEINKSSIANNTTLLVGKNNAGKTTIIRALEKLTAEDFNARDFNLDYIEEWRNTFVLESVAFFCPFSLQSSMTFTGVSSIFTRGSFLFLYIGNKYILFCDIIKTNNKA